MFRLPDRLTRGLYETGIRSAALCTIFVSAVAAPGHAQETGQVPSSLSVEEAIRIAMRSNPQYLQTANNIDVQRAAERVAKFALVPTVSIGAGVNANYRETQTALDEFGQPLQQPRAVITKTSTSSQFISVGNITLFDGGRTFRDMSIAGLNTDLAQVSLDQQANTLRAGVIRAYYQVVNAEEGIGLAEQLLQNAQERLDLVEQQFRIAAAKQTDLLGAEIDVSTQEQSLEAARAQVSRLRLQLLQALGVSGMPDFELTSGLPAVFDPVSLDAGALVARALASHPDMVSARTTVELADKQLANSKAARLPTLSLGLPGYSWGETRRGLFDAWGELGSPNRSFSLSLSASMPIFNGFSTSQQIEQSRANAQDRRYAVQQQRLATESAVRGALIDLGQRHSTLILAQAQADLAQQRLELAQEEYRLGGMTFTNLQQIITANEQSQRQVLDAQLQFLNALVSLEESIGGPLNPNQ